MPCVCTFVRLSHEFLPWWIAGGLCFHFDGAGIKHQAGGNNGNVHGPFREVGSVDNKQKSGDDIQSAEIHRKCFFLGMWPPLRAWISQVWRACIFEALWWCDPTSPSPRRLMAAEAESAENRFSKTGKKAVKRSTGRIANWALKWCFVLIFPLLIEKKKKAVSFCILWTYHLNLMLAVEVSWGHLQLLFSEL